MMMMVIIIMIIIIMIFFNAGAANASESGGTAHLYGVEQRVKRGYSREAALVLVARVQSQVH